MPKGYAGRPPCSVDGCDRVNEARGFCGLHYGRFRKTGDPLNGGRPANRMDAFTSSYVVDGSGCWLWQKSRVTNGYAAFWDGGIVTGHRWSYLTFVGPIPDGMQIDHLCRVRHCVNPEHLEPVTLAENVLRGIGLSAQNARKTHCKRGHPFDEGNTVVGRKGERVCRECRNTNARERGRRRAQSA